MKYKNKGYRNKDPKFFERQDLIKKKVTWFLNKESKMKLSKRFNNETRQPHVPESGQKTRKNEPKKP